MSDDFCPANRVRLDGLAHRISAELSLLLNLSLQLQDAMSCCTSLRCHESTTHGALQGIDRISQGLCDLALLVAEIGLRTPDSILLEREPLDARLRLRDLSLRLQLHDPSPPDCICSGSTELMREPGEILFF